MGKAKVSISSVTKYRDSVIEENSSAVSLKSTLSCVDTIVRKANTEIVKLSECEKNCVIADRTAGEKLSSLKAELSRLQSELSSTPPTITVSKPCGTDDEGNTIYEDVEEPNPQYYALLDQIAAVNSKISMLNALKGELQAKQTQLSKSENDFQDAINQLQRGKSEIASCCDTISRKSDSATETLAKAVAAIQKYMGEQVHTEPVPSHKSVNWISTLFRSHKTPTDSLNEANEVGHNSDSSNGTPSIETIESISRWVKDINPNYNPYSPKYHAYSVNCGSCAFAVEQRLSGKDRAHVASNKNISTDRKMERATGRKCVYMPVEEISQRLIQAGAGSHLIVGINREPIMIDGKKVARSGHWFNAYYDGNRIYTIEGQSGNIYEWPHDYGGISEWCALI